MSVALCLISLGLMGSNPQAPKNSPPSWVTVRPGDTLAGIAQKLNISQQSILDLNDDLDANRIRVGQKIIVPSSSSKSIKKGKNKISIPVSRQSLASLPSSEVPLRLLSINLIGAPLNPSDLNRASIFTSRLASGRKKLSIETIDLLWPVETRSISSAWGPRIRSAIVKLSNGQKKRIKYQSSHEGVDLTAPSGTNVYAAMDGTVDRLGFGSKIGNYIVINHGNGFETVYGHNKRNYVVKGAEVIRGQKIAEVGKSGNASGNHLHFELRARGMALNPLPYLNDQEEIPIELQANNAQIGSSNKKRNF